MQDTIRSTPPFSARGVIRGYYQLRPASQDTVVVQYDPAKKKCREFSLARTSATQAIADLKQQVRSTPRWLNVVVGLSIGGTVLSLLIAIVSGLIACLTWLFAPSSDTSVPASMFFGSLIVTIGFIVVLFVLDIANEPRKPKVAVVDAIISEHLVSVGDFLPPSGVDDQVFFNRITPEVRDRLVSLIDSGEDDIVRAVFERLAKDAKESTAKSKAKSKKAREEEVASRVDEVLGVAADHLAH